MRGKYIWKNGDNNENTWMCFVKKVSVDALPQSCTAKIAADSKYWLYINGTAVVFEGGLKRGPSKNGAYYDEVDIAPYLARGENTVAVLVWYFGKSGFSHNSSGQGSLLFDSDIVCSDSSWLVKKHPAYVEADENDMKANFRFSESNIYFDASKDPGDWFAPCYDCSDWDTADVIEKSETLVKREIPQLRDYGLKDYENSAHFAGFTAKKETTLRLHLPYNAQLTPYFKITAPAGKRITIKSENYDDELYHTKSVMAVYYTKEGQQEYESLGWLNGENILYVIPEGVTVHELKYRESGYDTDFAGSFECDDELMNRLWQKSLRTLYITMRDNFMDCPDRERAQWWGDVNVEMQMMMYSLDKRALLLYKKGVDTMALWAEDSDNIITVVPSGTEQFELPFQNLAGIWGFWYYYEYTGDRSVIERAYNMSKSYVLSYKIGSDGLVEHRKGSWDWPDWGDNSDTPAMENAWYFMALASCRKMAELLGIKCDTALFDARMESIRANYDRVFRKDGYYLGSTKNGAPDDRANALAVLSGLADPAKYSDIINVLLTTENASPYMEKYVLDAMCEMGYIDEAAERMKKRYRKMTEFDYSTLWEYWDKGGTLNHAWSGGPLITMSKYIAGIRPLSAAYETFEIKPHMGKLNRIKCTVPSAAGEITLDIERSGAEVRMSVVIPEGAAARVYLPLEEGRLPKNPGYSLAADGSCALFNLSCGNYDLLA